jgi:hypothetical protein
MKLTKKSLLLIPHFLDNSSNNNNNNNNTNNKNNTNAIIESIYLDILNAYDYLNNMKKKIGIEFYQITVKQITSIYHIPRPKNFNAHSFPYKIRKHIDEMSFTEISYTFSLFERKITLYFITEEHETKINIQTYNKYVETIVMWLYILNEYASKKCSQKFTVYFYFTSLEKRLPNSNIEILDEHHVNTAFTSTCPRDSEIIIFRKEEWFKVFMHETFHNFSLDFSDMNTYRCTQNILSLFPVKSQVNLYESYTEFWAEFMNCCFCSFFSIKDKNDFNEFIKYLSFYIELERRYSFFQMVKTLDFMGLQYNDLYSNSVQSSILRSTLYKERTNVLSYYVLKTVLLHHYPLFLRWCKTNNLTLMQFKKTNTNLEAFCDFIAKNYKARSLLQSVNLTQEYLYDLQKRLIKKSGTKKDLKKVFLLTNMRMSICELG